MMQSEEWVMDSDPSFAQALGEFAQALQPEEIDALAHSGDPDLLRIMAYMGVPRYLILLRSLADAMGGGEDSLVNAMFAFYPANDSAAGDSALFGVCLDRLAHLERTAILQHVYGRKRVEELARILQEVT